MRAVALSDRKIQQTVNESFIPLKVVMTYPPKMKAFPLDWPAMRSWRIAYSITSGQGFTGCSVVSPDLKTEYGSTGSAMVWEMFDSIAYDQKKFQAMLDRSIEHAKQETKIRDEAPNRVAMEFKLAGFRRRLKETTRERIRLPPKGFTKEHAIELFELSGDLPKKNDKAIAGN